MNRYFNFDITKYKDKKCNFHTHTTRCQHAYGTEREYIENAIAAGFEVLGFSDHAPYFFENQYVSSIRMKMAQLEGYVTTIEKLKEEYKNDIKIFNALEMEYFPSLFEKTIQEISKYPFDYLLLAQHFFLDEDWSKSTRAGWSDEEHLRLYVSLLTDALDTGYFNLVAHPDIIAFTGDEKLYTKYITMLTERLKQEQIPVEINVNGLRANVNYPDSRFIKIAAKTGNDFIIGVDAHTPDDFFDTKTYESCLKLAECAGGTVYWK